MSFKEVKTNEVPFWDFEKDKELTGVLLTKEKAGKFQTKLYTIQTENDEIFKFWGTQQLDSTMALVEEQTKIRITYTGTETSSTGREYKTFKVEKWEEN